MNSARRSSLETPGVVDAEHRTRRGSRSRSPDSAVDQAAPERCPRPPGRRARRSAKPTTPTSNAGRCSSRCRHSALTRSTERPIGFAPIAPPRVSGCARSGRSDSGLMPGRVHLVDRHPGAPPAAPQRAPRAPSARRVRPSGATGRPRSAARRRPARTPSVGRRAPARRRRRAAVGVEPLAARLDEARLERRPRRRSSRPGRRVRVRAREVAVARAHARRSTVAPAVEDVAQAESTPRRRMSKGAPSVVGLLAAEARQTQAVRGEAERPRPLQLQRRSRAGSPASAASRRAPRPCRRGSSSAAAGAATRGSRPVVSSEVQRDLRAKPWRSASATSSVGGAVPARARAQRDAVEGARLLEPAARRPQPRAVEQLPWREADLAARDLVPRQLEAGDLDRRQRRLAEPVPRASASTSRPASCSDAARRSRAYGVVADRQRATQVRDRRSVAARQEAAARRAPSTPPAAAGSSASAWSSRAPASAGFPSRPSATACRTRPS